MICGNCGTSNRPDAKFCVECGTGLAATCPNGHPISAGAKFCPECGARVADAAAAVAAGPGAGAVGTAPTTERRLVSVLFADLVGFTTLSEGRDSEAVRELLSRYFELGSDVIRRYGGTVEKFIGDAVMAVWGTPVAHEDDAERAVRAALDLVDAIRGLGIEVEAPDLKARAGVLTGEAAVAIGATNQGMVAGDLVNTASRVQSVAEPGTVLVGEATRRAAAEAIAFEEVGPQSLKGKSSPVAVFRALRVVGTVGGALRSESLEPPFVGRDTEFRLLRELFNATARDRRARLVSLTGQAGVGKSRLAWEFHKYIDGIADVVYWHQGRSPSYGDGVTFWALGEMVRKRAGLAESDDEPTTRARIAGSVAQHVADPGERELIEPALLALLGLEEPPPGGRDRLFAAWRLFIERLSAEHSVVLVFEDLHWADDGMLDFIEHLLEWSASYPILVVTLARPELLDRRPTWAAGGRSTSSLPLGPLAEADMHELLAGLVPDLPEPAVEAILRRADGIPLYAVEIVRMLAADGRLAPDGEGRFRPTGELGQLEVPETLHALIAARLDGLDADDRSLLQDASVLGQTFTVEALADLTGIAPEPLERRLRALMARELVALDTDPASPERGQFGFVQALIREVAYSTLARRERRARHLAAARYFEARGDDELAGMLASHYLDAYRASPDGPEGEAVRVQARIALRAAAERAAGLGSNASAVTFLEQALGLGGLDPAEEGDLLERAGTAATHAGQYERAIELLGRAVAVWRGVGDPQRLGGAVAAHGFAVMTSGQMDQALSYLEAARDEFRGDDVELARARMLARIGHIHVRRGEAMGALEAADAALPIAERHLAAELTIDALITKASALVQVGRDVEAELLIEGAVRRAAELGLVALHMRALANRLVGRFDTDPRRALEFAQETIHEATRYGIRQAVVSAVTNATELGVRAGEWTWAREQIDAVLALDLAPFDRYFVGAAASMLALHQGRTDDPLVASTREMAGAFDPKARRLVEADLAYLERLFAGDYRGAREAALVTAAEDDLNAPTAYERAGRAALWLGDVEAARSDHDALLALGRRGVLPSAQLETLRVGQLAREGRREQAVVGYSELVERYRAMKLTFDRAIVQLDAARLLGAASAEGRAAADEARVTFEQLGARPWLEMLDEVVSGAPTELPSESGPRGVPAAHPVDAAAGRGG